MPHSNGAFSLIFRHRYLTATALTILIGTHVFQLGNFGFVIFNIFLVLVVD